MTSGWLVGEMLKKAVWRCVGATPGAECVPLAGALLMLELLAGN